MECSSFVDLSESYSYTPFVKGWGTKESKTNVFDVSHDEEIEDMIGTIDDLPGIKSKGEILA
jgi:hypothetical protein